MKIQRCFLGAIVWLGCFTVQAQNEDVTLPKNIKFGVGLNPVVTISSTQSLNGIVFNRREVGGIVTGTLNAKDRFIYEVGVGFTSNKYTSKSSLNKFFEIQNTFVTQLSAVNNFFKLTIVGDSYLNIGLGLTGILSVGQEKSVDFEGLTITSPYGKFSAAPILRSEIVLMKNIVIRTQIGFAAAYTNKELKNFSSGLFLFKPLLRNHLLGQTGLTIYI